MTINKEEITVDSQDNPISIDGFRNDEDRKLLVSLLNEYGDKLLRLCEQIEELQSTLILFSFAFAQETQSGVEKYLPFFFGLFLVIFVTLIVLVDPKFASIDPKPSSVDPKFALLHAPEIMGAVSVVIISSMAIAWITAYSNKIIAKGKILKKEARVIYIRLEKVVRIAYQVQENLTPNLITRVELDLRLADAESALEYYNTITKQK